MLSWSSLQLPWRCHKFVFLCFKTPHSGFRRETPSPYLSPLQISISSAALGAGPSLRPVAPYARPLPFILTTLLLLHIFSSFFFLFQLQVSLFVCNPAFSIALLRSLSVECLMWNSCVICFIFRFHFYLDMLAARVVVCYSFSFVSIDRLTPNITEFHSSFIKYFPPEFLFKTN